MNAAIKTERKNIKNNFSKNPITDSIHERMLSIYPTSKGFGYLILEDIENIID